MSEDKALLQINRAQRASALLNDEAFVEVIDSVHKDLIDRWELSKDPSERERLWVSVDILKKIVQALRATASGAGVDRRNLDDIQSGLARKHFGVV